METTLVYFILITSLIFPLLQLYVSMNYCRQFAFEYLSNRPISWNPDYDRSAVTFSIVFGLFSTYLMIEIWQGNTDNSWIITIFYFLLIVLFSSFTLVFIRYIKNEKLLTTKQIFNNVMFLENFEKKIELVYNYLTESNFFAEDTTMLQFKSLFNKKGVNHKIICIAKAGNNFSYVPLIIFYKVILKDQFFTLETIKREFSKKYLFKKKDSDTGILRNGELNDESLKKAFNNIDSSIDNHQKLIDDLKKILM
ncbi:MULTISPECIES: hypothetical protein [Chryseobacterium]|uniref:hypothetical protein n=1 Tax=Chryseobacterium TaxID=59732 RepID=UPI00195E7467|nr:MULTISPECIES: hypothetical protein [Chryseobacterium]MBM7421045.1 hypothetical protein [Chryseobacterium sp. JUb44]MDH6211003.1 hypothetical protein [Chryseobacterium sp. BIGb0186]WSO09668.1 hypothetical protein VUJ64_17765 [Chryseobacterium scophthalmum]